MYYVLVKETGEYSGMDYQPIEIHTTYEDAENSKILLQREIELQNKIASIRGKWNDRTDYVIFEVSKADKKDINKEIENLEEKYKNKLEEAIQWRKEFNIAKEIENNIAEEKNIKEQKEKIDIFIDWWDNSKDPYFEEKKQPKIREIKGVVYSYLLKTNDKDILQWMRQNGIM